MNEKFFDIIWINENEFEQLYEQLKQNKDELHTEVKSEYLKKAKIILNKIFIYYPDKNIDNLNFEESLNIIRWIKILKINFWNDFLKFLILKQPLTIDWQSKKIDNLPFSQLKQFILDINNLAWNQLKDNIEIIYLTNEELKWIENSIFTWQFWIALNQIKDDISQTISTQEIIEWTNFYQKAITKYWSKEKVDNILNWLDKISFEYIKSQNPNINMNVWKNLSSWINYILFFTLSQLPQDRQVDFFKNIEKLTNKEITLIQFFQNFSINNINFLDKIKWFLDIIDKYCSQNNQWEKNEIIMNPVKLNDFFENFYLKNKTDQELIEKLKTWEKNSRFDWITQQDRQTILWVFNNINPQILEHTWQISSSLSEVSNWLWAIRWSIDSLRGSFRQMVWEDPSWILWIKEMLVSIGIWDSFKKLIDFIFKFFWWYKDWFEWFEREFWQLNQKELNIINKMFWFYQENKSNDTFKNSDEQNSFLAEISNNLPTNRKWVITNIKLWLFKESLKKANWEWLQNRIWNYCLPVWFVINISQRYDELKPILKTQNWKQEINENVFKQKEEQLINLFISEWLKTISSNELLFNKAKDENEAIKLMYAEFIKYWNWFDRIQRWIINITTWYTAQSPMPTTTLPNQQNTTENLNWSTSIDSIKNKTIEQLNYQETLVLTKHIFWEWIWTNRLIDLSKPDNLLILKKIIALYKRNWKNQNCEIKKVDDLNISIWAFNINWLLNKTDNQQSAIVKYLQNIWKIIIDTNQKNKIWQFITQISWQSLNDKNFNSEFTSIITELKKLSWLSTELQIDLTSFLWNLDDEKINKLKDPNLQNSNEFIWWLVWINNFDFISFSSKIVSSLN